MTLFLQAVIYIILCEALITVAHKMDATPEKCAAFAKFAEKWNALPETIPVWIKDNCHKVHPRPADMTCDDVEKFVADCKFGGVGEFPREETAETSLQSKAAAASPLVLPPYPVIQSEVLPRYIHGNRQTVYDYGQFGNWYYPNVYPSAYLNFFGGDSDSQFHLENDYKFTQGGHYPYHRADNMVNIALQQTSLPTCLHDIIFCAQQSIAAQRWQQQVIAAQVAQQKAAASQTPPEEARHKRSLDILRRLL